MQRRLVSVRGLLSLAGIAGLSVLAACGSSHTTAVKNATTSVRSPTPSTQYTYNPAAANVPKCTLASKAINLPPNFPQNFPVPRGTIIDAASSSSDGGRIVNGFIPISSFTTAVTFFPAQIKPAGFTLLHLSVNAPHDSEGSFQGQGFTGTWTIKAWCSGAMALQITAKPTA